MVLTKGKNEIAVISYKACFSRIYTEDKFSQNKAEEKVHL